MNSPTPDQIHRARAAIIVDDGSRTGLLHCTRMRMHWRILRQARDCASAAPRPLITRDLPPSPPFDGDAA